MKSTKDLDYEQQTKIMEEDIIIPNIVDTKAIFNVSTTPIQAVEQVKSSHPVSVHTGYA